MYKVALLASVIVALVLQPPADAERLRTIRAIANTIRIFRLRVLEDQTPIDFCAVEDFWDSNGKFVAADEVGDLIRYRSQLECMGKKAPEFRSVTLTSLRIAGDSVVAVTETRKNGSRIAERYSMLGAKSGQFCCSEYRVFRIVVD